MPKAWLIVLACAACGGPSSSSNGSIDSSEIITVADIAPSDPTLAVSSSGAVLVAWANDYGGDSSTLGYAFSTDRGTTFENSHTLSAPGDNSWIGGERVAVDADGNFYLLVLASQSPGSETTVYLATAHAGANSFGSFKAVGDQSAELLRSSPSLALAQDGSIVASWLEGSDFDESNLAPTGDVVVARSSDRGATWTTTMLTTTGGVGPASLCASQKSDRVVALYEDATDNTLGLRFSTDGGSTWPGANTASLALAPVGNLIDTPSCLLGDPDLWILDTATMYATFTDQGMLADKIVLIHSGDGGVTFDAAIPVQDDAAGPYYASAAAFLQAGDGISLGYYAGDPSTGASVRYSHSIDGGRTFTPSIALFQPIAADDAMPPQWVSGLALVDDSHSAFVTYLDAVSAPANLRISRRAP